MSHPSFRSEEICFCFAKGLIQRERISDVLIGWDDLLIGQIRLNVSEACIFQINIENCISTLVMFLMERVLPQTTICLGFRCRQCTKHLRFDNFDGFKRFILKTIFK